MQHQVVRTKQKINLPSSKHKEEHFQLNPDIQNHIRPELTSILKGKLAVVACISRPNCHKNEKHATDNDKPYLEASQIITTQCNRGNKHNNIQE